MKRFAIVSGFLLMGIFAGAQYKVTDDGSSVKFRVKNFGFNSGGFFSGLKGTIQFDPNNLATAVFDVTVNAASVNTDNESRDSHLREESYFDVKNHPLIHFVSGKITGTNRPGNYQVTGKLTIKATTKEISFPFTAAPSQDGYLFKGEFRINRRDFGVGGGSTISDNVDVILAVQSRKS